MKHTTKAIIAAILLVSMLPTVTATVNLESVSYDPTVITAGDRVNITTTLHERLLPDNVEEDGSTLDVYLRPDNKLTRDHVIIEDDRDTPIYIPPAGNWNQRFQVRVEPNAPTGQYDFDVVMNTTSDGKTYTSTGSFKMPVDREGVDLNGHLISTEPRDLRPGDDNTKLAIEWTNTGNKPIEEISIDPALPEHIQPSYSDDETFYINRLGVGESTQKEVSIDIDKPMEPGRYNAFFATSYEDRSGNTYEEDIVIPVRVEGRPDLDITTEQTNVTSATSNTVAVTVSNTGEQDAETVSARTIIERSQPFSASDRSVYIGEIESGEASTAVFNIEMDETRLDSEHQLKLELQATGDSDKGDRSVYTWTETTNLNTTDEATSWLPYLGLLGGLLAISLYFYSRRKQ